MDRYGDGGARRLLPLFGGVMVAVAWLGLWWDAGVARRILPGESIQPLWSEFSRAGGIAMLLAGVAGVTLALFHVVRQHRRAVAELRLREAELSESRERLRRYVVDLERVAHVSSHDMQEPLRRMVAYAQLLEHHGRDGLDEEGRVYVGHVVDAARRMKALVSGLRAYASVDSLPQPETRTSAIGAVGVARQRLGESLSKADVALVVDPLPDVAADHASLVEIFVQLIDNGIRFRSAGRRPVIHVSASRVGAMVEFSVRDNGIGIAPGRVARMFEIFYRPHETEAAAGGGVGMGLAVVRRLVERLGGAVKVASAAGEGSTFSFTLPADPAPPAAMIRKWSQEATST
ncbi:ATP-binding protein [Magnetospirillum sp. SS-4]|uniref:sensor histidine kinase n=1 Tax=Magnetospirillum sp. SS-4 TaxID=2681465 RepID=UPI00137DD25C|nr:ATP-binding protein [Magnetospirillum sp. SS-4]CAA7616165.1 Signal transduction histidine kinase [Magnetospirillum sp. SS-4]